MSHLPHARSHSRRFTLALLGAGTLTGIGLLARSSRAVAQDDTATTGADDLPAILQEWLIAWSQDPGRAEALYAEAATLEDVPIGSLPGETLIEGREQILAFIDAEFSAFTDRNFEIRSALVTEGQAAIEAVYSGSYTGSYGRLPAGTGQPFSLPVVVIVEWDGDTIVREAHYYDVYGFLIQLGVISRLA